MPDSLIDPESWEMMKSQTDPEFLAELIDMYLADSPDLIAQMRRGLAEGNCELVRRAAHTLKSNSASLGALRLTGAARALEMTAKTGSLEGAAPQLALVEDEYALVSPLLAEMKS